MKKLLLSLTLLTVGFAQAQTTIFEDSFEDYDDFIISDVGSWTLTDVDLLPTYGFTGITFDNSGVAKSFQVFNSTTTTPAMTPTTTSDWSARTGSKNMVCFAAVPSTTGGATKNNDWLISPQITLGTSNVLSFWAKACDATYAAEKFSVWVSTTDTNTTSFTKISTGNAITTPGITWAQYTYNLATTYDNLPVYIAIKCTSTDQFGFAVDDFLVTGTVLATENFFTSNFAIYPNPTTDIINIKSKNNVAINNVQITDINGRVVNEVNLKSEANTQINISELTAGVYFLKITTDQGVGSTKIIKK